MFAAMQDHAKFYIGEMILALEFLHSHGIVHRDLKVGAFWLFFAFFNPRLTGANVAAGKCSVKRRWTRVVDRFWIGQGDDERGRANHNFMRYNRIYGYVDVESYLSLGTIPDCCPNIST